jgi:hypothetical protein
MNTDAENYDVAELLIDRMLTVTSYLIQVNIDIAKMTPALIFAIQK